VLFNSFPILVRSSPAHIPLIGKKGERKKRTKPCTINPSLSRKERSRSHFNMSSREREKGGEKKNRLPLRSREGTVYSFEETAWSAPLSELGKIRPL